MVADERQAREVDGGRGDVAGVMTKTEQGDGDLAEDPGGGQDELCFSGR